MTGLLERDIRALRPAVAAHLAGKVTTATPTSIASAVSLANLRTDPILSLGG